MPLRHWMAALAALGLIYLCLTPPLKVPDELGHFLRSAAIAQGHVIPTARAGPEAAAVPVGYKNLLFILHTLPAGPQRQEQFRLARQVALQPGTLAVMSFPAMYTPLPYLPTVVPLAAGAVLNLRPLHLFYIGRLFNLIVAILLCAAAIRAMPAWGAVVAGVASLPMSLFLFASWSPDAMLIPLTLLLVALLARSLGVSELMDWKEGVALIGAAAGVALIKPYVLTVLLILLIPTRRFSSRSRRALFIAVFLMCTAAATVISLWYVQRGSYNPRTELPVSSVSQWQCIASDPSRAARVFFDDVARHGDDYLEQMIGRLGLLEIALPQWLIWMEVAALLLFAATAPVSVTPGMRAACVAIALVMITLVIVAQYLSWSVVCSDVVEGVQGRYFLPILPLVLLAVSGLIPRPLSPRLVLLVACISNGAAFRALLDRYWQ